MDSENLSPIRKHKLLVFGGVVVAIILAALVFTLKSPDKQTLPVTEVDGPGTVIIDNTDRLSGVLLAEQYTVVHEELVKYIETKIDENIEHAFIVDGLKINNDGIIEFTVRTKAPEKTFTVKLDRIKYFNKVIFSISADHYKKTLPVYNKEVLGE